MPLLTRDFFARPCLEVAQDLLGCHLLRDENGIRRAGQIVEAEAYLGGGQDPGSHAHRGETQRNRAMFGPPGRFYVYLSMGLHICANVVCEDRGSAAALLIRAVEPLEGLEAMCEARGGRSGPELTSGPGKLCQAFGITLDDYGRSALRGPLRVEMPARRAAQHILVGPRIGLSQGAALPYRYFISGNAYVTRSRLNRSALPAEEAAREI